MNELNNLRCLLREFKVALEIYKMRYNDCKSLIGGKPITYLDLKKDIDYLNGVISQLLYEGKEIPDLWNRERNKLVKKLKYYEQ